MKKLIFSFATIALAVSSAASYNVTIYEPAQAGDRQLKPGEYKLEVKDNVAVFSKGKEKIQTAVKVENTDTKYAATTVRFANPSEIQEIRLRGTNTKLVFSNSNGTAGQQ